MQRSRGSYRGRAGDSTADALAYPRTSLIWVGEPAPRSEVRAHHSSAVVRSAPLTSAPNLRREGLFLSTRENDRVGRVNAVRRYLRASGARRNGGAHEFGA